jgi:hypothetical protein
MGSIYKRGAVYWIKYYRNGVPMPESADSDKESVAKKLLRDREATIDRGVPVTPQTNRVTLSELLDDVLTDYKVNGRRSLDTVTYYIEGHLRPYFGTRKAASITTADVRAYVAERQVKEAANATINRELAALTRACSLGIEAGCVTHKPTIRSLKENNTRKGFFEREQFEGGCGQSCQCHCARWSRSSISRAGALTPRWYRSNGGKWISRAARCASTPARPRTTRRASCR